MDIIPTRLKTETMPKNNYRLQAERSRELFLTYDQEAIIRKLKLPHDAAHICVRFLGATLRIERATGHIEGCADDDTETPLAVYDYLCCSREDRSLSGEWVSMERIGFMFHRELLSGGLFARMSRYCDAYPARLAAACLALGGVKKTPGDVGYVLPLFDELFVWLQFRRGDEEFPSKLSLLWDRNVTLYVHYETLYYLAAILFRTLRAQDPAEPRQPGRGH
jgi:hypothetical protein